ncbi:hypothetical protein PybrP1_001657 [[Pythium] brassicae (nom. inval.)]|nr:hypothetical protein PybrP1_001657 [[Pythium] brassicae (nom. inval.)]
MKTPCKRRNWSDDRDLMLLCSSSPHCPFLRRGGRFSIRGMRWRTDSTRASGVTEHHSDRHQLLDDLVATYDDNDQRNANHTESKRKRRAEDEARGAAVRDAAM